MSSQSVHPEITDYRVHFDAIYVGGIPNLLNDDGAFLSFLAVLTATEALAGLYAPRLGPGERFREFVIRFFPVGLNQDAQKLWQFRNAMIHSFNPGPYGLTHHNSRSHLAAPHGLTMLNAEDFYAAMLTASQGYFATLASDPELQACFLERIQDAGGGAPQAWVVQEARTPNAAPSNNVLE